WVELDDQSTLPGHAVSRVVHVPGRAAVRWDVETWCVRRGRYRLGPAQLRSGDPLGLFPTWAAAPAAHELVVYPAIVAPLDAPPPAGVLPGGSALDRRSLSVTPSVSGVRDYTPSDGFNRISWTASARTGRLMVKEFDLDPTADVWIVLDLEAASHRAATRPLNLTPDAQGRWPLEAWLDSTLEYAVTIAASLACHYLHEGRNVGLIASGRRLDVLSPDRSDRQRVKILEDLAVVEADGVRPLAEALIAEGRRFRRTDAVVVITASIDESWVAALVELAGRHVRASAVLIEPDTFGLAPSSLLVVSGMLAANIPATLVKYGDRLAQALGAASVAAPPFVRR
ncbi:MAG TPA: DUF58 domain-containing protein, partial [Thermomicrobiales bacterium]|nr:DUF58 domain-containing protein [Thermomicrobiales bacterium]